MQMKNIHGTFTFKFTKYLYLNLRKYNMNDENRIEHKNDNIHCIKI